MSGQENNLVGRAKSTDRSTGSASGQSSPKTTSSVMTINEQTYRSINDRFIPNAKHEYEKHQAKLKLLEKQIAVEKATEHIEKERVELEKLENTKGPGETEIDILTHKVSELQKTHDEKQVKLKKLEQSLQVNGTHQMTTAEKISARKAEAEVMKLRASILESEIEVLESTFLLETMSAKNEGANQKFKDAQGALGKLEFGLIDLKSEYEKLESAFFHEYLAGEDEEDHGPACDLQEQLKSASKLNEELARENEQLKAAAPAAPLKSPELTTSSVLQENTNNTNTTLINDPAKVVGDDATEAKKKALQDQIEHMYPLYHLGRAIRSKKIELDLKNAGKISRMNTQVYDEANDATLNAHPVADSVLYIDFLSNGRVRPAVEFPELYSGVSPIVVWQKRHFAHFQRALAWNMDMKRLASVPNRKRFEDNFAKIFPRLLEDSDINCDDDFVKHPELKEAFAIMAAERSSAFIAFANRNRRY